MKEIRWSATPRRIQIINIWILNTPPPCTSTITVGYFFKSVKRINAKESESWNKFKMLD